MQSQFVLLSGASTGIGNATALYLANQGMIVYAGVRNEKDAAALRAAAPDHIRPIQLDVTKPEDIKAAFERLDAETGQAGLTALINNAGINYVAPLELSEEKKVRQLMEVNVFGLINLTQKMLPLLQRNGQNNPAGAKIINVGSIGSAIGIPWEFAYHTSKFAVLGLSQSWKFELEALNIKVACIMPGGIKTPFFTKTNNDIHIATAALAGPNGSYYRRNMEAMTTVANTAARFASPPEKVAKAIQKAIQAKRPRLRILVGVDAKLIYTLVWLGWTRLLKGQFVKK